MLTTQSILPWARRLQGAKQLQWRRGVRASIAVGSVMAACHVLGIPPAAAALGAFNPLLVDNGGPYRTRLTSMVCALIGGAVALILGSVLPQSLFVIVPATLLFCFALTYARVISQPIASTSVLVLILYFAGLGGTLHTLHSATVAATLILAGGLWAIALSLFLWPVDPFRPARLAVATCYTSLADFTATLPTPVPHEDQNVPHPTHTWQRHQRLRIEEARNTLSATSARMPSRTIRARNLTVLLETSDMLLACTLRLTELADLPAPPATLATLTLWLATSQRAIGDALTHHPADNAASFSLEGSHRLQLLAPLALTGILQSEHRDALLDLSIAFDAVRAIWTGAEPPQIALLSTLPLDPAANPVKKSWDLVFIDSTWLDSLRANWTLSSANLRHALRLMVVGTLDVIVMRLIHLNHGFWLPMTSIILMQPFSAGTNRKSLQRVTGTILGGFLAAFLAFVIPGPLTLLLVILALSGLTLAAFSVDYAVYCFFLTPTFVLLSLPHPHDWRYAGIRVGLTLAGATIAVLAMRLLWPERAPQELAHLFRRGASADAAYLHATLKFWSVSASARRTADRQILAPARRACGLASNDAEEAVDRILQEPAFTRFTPGSGESRQLAEQSLTFTTYLRRLTQSITTLASLGRCTPTTRARLQSLATRLQQIATAKPISPKPTGPTRPTLVDPTDAIDATEQQLLRIERQVGILERTAATLPT